MNRGRNKKQRSFIFDVTDVTDVTDVIDVTGDNEGQQVTMDLKSDVTPES